MRPKEFKAGTQDTGPPMSTAAESQQPKDGDEANLTQHHLAQNAGNLVTTLGRPRHTMRFDSQHLRAASLRRRRTPRDIPYTWNLKHGTDEPVSQTETD